MTAQPGGWGYILTPAPPVRSEPNLLDAICSCCLHDSVTWLRNQLEPMIRREVNTESGDPALDHSPLEIRVVVSRVRDPHDRWRACVPVCPVLHGQVHGGGVVEWEFRYHAWLENVEEKERDVVCTYRIIAEEN